MSLEASELRLAEPGAAERDAMDRRVFRQLGLEIPGRNHVGEFDESRCRPARRVSARPCCEHRSVMKIFFLLVAISSPLGRLLVRRQRTAPVTLV